MNDQNKISLQSPFLKTFADLKDIYAEITWTWHNWLPNGFVTMLASDAGVGKSMLALTVAHIVLHGKAWFDGMPYIPDVDSTVLWVECESGEPFHVHRAQSMRTDLTRIAIPYSLDEPNVVPSLSNTNDRERIGVAFADESHRLLVIDSLSGATNSDENSTDAGKVVQWLAELAKHCNKPVLLIHHMNKHKIHDVNQPPSISAIRGSSAIAQHPRVIWTLDNPDPTRPEIVRLAQAKNNLAMRPKYLTLQIEHGRIAPAPTANIVRDIWWQDDVF